MRVLVAFGTRPEIIKLGPVCRALRRRAQVRTDVFWTGQHVELAAGLFELFEIEVAFDAGRDVMHQPGLGGKLGQMIKQIESALIAGRYDWIVVQGDTLTAAAGAMAGFLNRVPVAHVEAGLRTGDLSSPWPEEFNRRAISIASALHFAPTKSAADNLRKEGIPDERIMEVGNTVVDALLYVRTRAGRGYHPVDPEIASLPPDKKLVLATLHRRENIGLPMREALRALRTLGEDGDKIIVLPAHLNPPVRAEAMAMLNGAPNVRLVAPLRYPDFVHLLARAWVVVSDSGGIQEEAPTFGVPVLVARDTTERPEAIECGFARLVGSDYAMIVEGVRAATGSPKRQLVSGRNPFGRGDSGERIAAALVERQKRPALAAAE